MVGGGSPDQSVMPAQSLPQRWVGTAFAGMP